MARNESPDRDSVSKLSRRGLLTLGATLAGLGGLKTFSGTASAHGLMAFRDAFIGNDGDKTGLGSKGWLFFAKDTETVYYHDGSSWQNLLTGGRLTDTDGDGLLEAPNHDGIDVGTLETDEIHLGADKDGDGSEWRFNTDSSDTARIYSWDGSAATEYLRVNEGGPVEVTNANLNLNSGKVSEVRHLSTNNWLTLHTSGAGTDAVQVKDEANGKALFRAFEGGPVEVKNTVLSLAHEQSSTPSAPSSGAKLWVDSDDGNLKATFSNGTTSTIATN